MKTVNVHEAKTNFSSLLATVEDSSESFVICRNGEPVADLVPHRRASRIKPHPILGKMKIKYDPAEPATEDRVASEVSVILDTCALLWLASGNKKLSRAALKKINEAPAVYVSAISGFEISLKVCNGKLELSHPVEKWFGQMVDHHGLTILPLALDVCIAAAKLPPIHDDPFDRFIIAAAKLHDLTVVTSDEQFEKYSVTVVS